MICKSYELVKNVKVLKEKNIFLLYGENLGLKDELKEKIFLEKKQSKQEIIKYYEDDILNNIENFYNSILSGSLFDENRIILIKSATDKIFPHIKELYDKQLSNITIIIISDVLDKKSKLRNFFEKNNQILCIPCYPDTIRDLEIIIKNKIYDMNIKLSPESINLLVSRANSDRNNLLNELNKLKALSGVKKEITLDEVKKITNSVGSINGEDFINTCLTGNINKYKRILEEINFETFNYIIALKIFNKKIERLIKIKMNEGIGKNIDLLINEFKPPIFWKEKPILKTQLKLFSLKELTKLISEINYVELNCKKNSDINKIIFLKFFDNLIKKKSNNFLL